MPSCLKCGAENELGRIFCFRCGEKMALAEPTAADLKIRKGSNAVASLSAFILVVLAVSGAVFGAMLWPQADALGQAPSKTGAQRVSLALRGLHLSEEADAVGRAFRESDINAYLEQIRVEELGIKHLSIELTQDRIRLRLRRDDEPWHILWMTFQPSYTRDLLLKPLAGGTVEVVGARIGHLPLPSAFAESTAARFRELFKGEREMLVLRRVQSIEVRDQAIALVVGKP